MKNTTLRLGAALTLSLVCGATASAQGSTTLEVFLGPNERYELTYISEVAEFVSGSPNTATYLLPAGSVLLSDPGFGVSTLTTDVTLFIQLGFDRLVFEFDQNTFMRFDGVGLTSAELPALQGSLSNATVFEDRFVFTAGSGAFLTQPFTDVDTPPIFAQSEDFSEGFCYGNEDSCASCPCDNAALFSFPGGCRNSTFRSAQLEMSDGELYVRDATLDSFAVLISGGNTMTQSGCPATGGMQSMMMDGLRCVGGNVMRHGVRPTDSDGETGTPWIVTPNEVPNGAPIAGQTIYVQAVYRESMTGGCFTGQNTTNALAIRPILLVE